MEKTQPITWNYAVLLIVFAIAPIAYNSALLARHDTKISKIQEDIQANYIDSNQRTNDLLAIIKLQQKQIESLNNY